MKVLFGVLGGGLAGFLLSHYLVPPSVKIPCGQTSLLVQPNGLVTLPNGTQVPVTTVCSLASGFIG